MGMDVVGQSSNYFRRNVWGWRPLWEYCNTQHGEIIGEEGEEKGYCNDGWGLDEVQSKKLAKALNYDIEEGFASEYIDARNAFLNDLDKEKCNLCNGTGKRETWPEHCTESWIKQCNGCNACNGEGYRDSILKSYYLDVEDIKEFAEFLKESNGFQIW